MIERSSSLSASSSSVSRTVGWKSCWAVRVGTNAEDEDGHQLGVLGPVDEVVGEAEQRGDGAEGQPGGHQQRGVGALPPWQPEGRCGRPDADHLGGELDQQQDRDHPGAGFPADLFCFAHRSRTPCACRNVCVVVDSVSLGVR